MPIDYSAIAAAGGIPKPRSRVLVERAQKNAEAREWSRTCRKVDERDKRTCQVTGRRLSPGAVDPWCALERHHVEYRSQNKGRRFTHVNVWTVCRAIHQLVHGGALRILNKAGRPAKDVREIDHLAWNRNLVAKGEEPCRVRKGLPVRKD